jgi:hypothetical protein
MTRLDSLIAIGALVVCYETCKAIARWVWEKMR